MRVAGRDIDPGAHEPHDHGLQCRLYRLDGKLVGVPPDEWVLAAVSHMRQQEATNE